MHPMPRWTASWRAVAVAVALCSCLIAVPVVAALATADPRLPRIAVFSALTLVVLLGGITVLHARGGLGPTPATAFRWAPLWFIAAVTVPWGFVIVDSPHGAYFLVALFALALWLCPPVVGTLVALALTVFAVGGQVVHHGWSAGAVIGPFVALAVVLALLQAYRVVVAESAEKSRLVDRLREAQDRLAASERDAGRLAERTRLGRDLHDTVAQSLSSIQLLLHTAEDTPDDAVRLERIGQARRAAADSLAETRAFIRDLTPPDLAGRSLATALERVAERAAARGLPVDVRLEGTPRHLPMPVEATLLRIAQESVTNAVAHAHASRCEIRLGFDDAAVTLDVDDDGVGFDVEAAFEAALDRAVLDAGGSDENSPDESALAANVPGTDGTPTAPESPTAPARSGGFGLPSIRARAADLGGHAVVVSTPGDGCLVSVTLPLDRVETR